MRRTSLGSGIVGTELASPIYNEKGQVLLNAGTELSPFYVGALQERGVVSINVQDAATADITIEGPLTEHTRAAVTGVVGKIFDVIAVAAQSLDRGDAAKAAPAASSTELRRAVEASLSMDEVHAAVDSIVEEALDAPVLSGLNSIKTHDNYTFCHSVDVAVTAIVIGRRLHLDRGNLKRLVRGCLLHDIGKVFVPGELLRKEGRLTPEELAAIRAHPSLGYELLRQLNPDDILVNHIAYQHHERQDGRGYPRGLRGTNQLTRSSRSDGFILLLAETASIADVHDALASDRPYRRGLAPEVIAAQIRELAGTHLNREMIDTFLTVLPVFPVGLEVVVTSGRYRGYRGVVARVNQRQLDRPVVRMLTNGRGQQLIPFDLDLARYPDVTIATVVDDAPQPVGPPAASSFATHS
ncbi:MAG: HD-GYP domain-containing protein [Chloroflexi bacterium]|nr:HD-GYP domain-containing protein [Chloroflexota bacterium]